MNPMRSLCGLYISKCYKGVKSVSDLGEEVFILDACTRSFETQDRPAVLLARGSSAAVRNPAAPGRH
ncbi:hypothetical protein EMIT0P294_30320 [Pseudomonas sp. IT-P294]